MLLEKCRIGVMLNLIQHLLWIVEIAGQTAKKLSDALRIFLLCRLPV